MEAGSTNGHRRPPRAVSWPAAALTAAALVAAMLGAACGVQSGPGTGDGEVVVMAASSLTEVIEIVFEGRDRVTPVIAGSSTLVAQLAAGAEADVLITADAATMEQAASQGTVRGEPVLIAVNALVLATPAGNPGGVTGLGDLARKDLLIGLCATEVPCGLLARRALDEAGIAPSADTLEPNVRALASKLSLGELDAGLVYATDARAAELATVHAPELEDHLNGYYIASVSAQPRPEVRTVINDFTALGSIGAKALYAHGFLGSDRRPVWPVPP
jgi:molybdate transport system substrate-binding protein